MSNNKIVGYLQLINKQAKKLKKQNFLLQDKTEKDKSYLYDWIYLYELKQKAIEKMIFEEKLSVVGYHTFGNHCFAVAEEVETGISFHFNLRENEIFALPYLGEGERTSARAQYEPTDNQLKEAIQALEAYVGFWLTENPYVVSRPYEVVAVDDNDEDDDN